MRKLSSLAALLTLAMIYGCGGGGGGDSDSTPSPFAGSYHDISGDPDPVSLAVSLNGDFVGTSSNSELGGTDTFKGHVSSSGNCSGRISNSTDSSYKFDVTGTFSLSGSGILTIIVSGNVDGDTVSGEWELARDGDLHRSRPASKRQPSWGALRRAK